MAYFRSYRKKLNWRKVKYEDGVSGVISKPRRNGGCIGKDRVMLMATLVFTLYKILMMKHLTPEEEAAVVESLLILVV
jgi:hypothetical protein